MVDGETFFVGKDVASALGYVNPTKAVSVHVDEEDRSMSEMDTHQRGSQMTIIINENRLYALILSSKLESAKDSSDGSPAKSFWRRFNELLM